MIPLVPSRRLRHWIHLVHSHGQCSRYPYPVSDEDEVAYALGSRALRLQEKGDLDGAMALHKQAQRLYRQNRNRDGMAASLKHQAQIAQCRADFDGILALYEDAEHLYRELGTRDSLVLSLRKEAKILAERRDMDGVMGLLALILFASVAEAKQLKFLPFTSSGIYRLGEKVGWTVWPSRSTATVAKYVYDIKKNNLETIKSGELDFESGSATIEVIIHEPAMLYVTVRPEGAAQGPTVHLGAAVEPTQLKPSMPRPEDFDAFWDEKLQSLSRTPANPVVSPLGSKEGVELSTVQLDSLGSRVHGYLATPRKPGPFPALVIFQYAGVYALRTKTLVGRAAEGWLAFSVSAHDLPPNQATGISPDYQLIGNTDRETSYFLNMYLRDVRAVDYISKHPAWDGKTLVLMGSCMGGQQALATAALRDQVSGVIVNKPSGADSNGEPHGRKPGYPYWPSTDPRAMATAPYFDIVNFAPRIQAPVLAALGFIDTTAPPAGIWAALNQTPGPKEIMPLIDSNHMNQTYEMQRVYNSRVKQVLDILLHGGVFSPTQSLSVPALWGSAAAPDGQALGAAAEIS